MKNIILFLAMLISFQLYAQVNSTVKGIIVDENDISLKFVNIYSNLDNHGTYSDEDGKFEINIKDNTAFIVFSYLGYQNDTTFITDTTFTKSIKVKLNSNPYALNELMVSSNIKFSEIGYSLKFGHIKKKENNDLGLNKGNILAYYFKNPQQTIGKIKSIKFRFTKSKNKPRIRINVYSPTNKKGQIMPGELVYQSNIITLKNKKSFKHQFPKSIFLSKKGLFVAIELVGGGDYVGKSSKFQLNYPRFMMTDDLKEHLTYKSFMGKKWNKLTIYSRNSSNPWNMKVELKVDY